MQHLRQAIYLAKKMGKGMGSSKILLGPLSR
jgi:hypothetical protein